MTVTHIDLEWVKLGSLSLDLSILLVLAEFKN